MTERTKNLVFMFAIALAAAGAAFLLLNQVNRYYQQEDATAGQDTSIKSQAGNTASDWQTYKNDVLEFQYPQKLAVKSENDQIILNHQVPFENYGCSMMGDDKTYPMLDDFNVKIKIVDGNIAQVAKKISPYMPAENFYGTTLKVNPGFIDKYQISDWNGFAIYEGAEGCGHTIYYFPVTSNKTLVVTKDMVQILSGVMSSNIKDELLKVPGVINNEESEQFFEKIMISLKITNTVDTTSWKTYRNEEYGFEFKYPNDWKFEQKISYQDGFFISKGESRLGVLPKGEFDYGTSLEGLKVSETILAGKHVTVKEWEKENENYHLIWYHFTDPMSNWLKCEQGLLACNRLDLQSVNNDDYQILQGIISTFKFTK